MRSFIGAFKVLSCVIPGCSTLLAKIDDTVAGRESKENIQWTDNLRASFHKAQAALSTAHTILLPIPSDQLWIIIDEALRKPGINATLYVSRSDKLHLAGVLVPNCVQACEGVCRGICRGEFIQVYEGIWSGVCRGEFLASPSVSTFPSTVSRYQASVRHVSGFTILLSDFFSHNAAPCEGEACTFTRLTQYSVIRCTSIQDILSGNGHLPFISRSAYNKEKVL